eukprot:361182-Chlamydomonas_euryale.AAC.8
MFWTGRSEVLAKAALRAWRDTARVRGAESTKARRALAHWMAGVLGAAFFAWRAQACGAGAALVGSPTASPRWGGGSEDSSDCQRLCCACRHSGPAVRLPLVGRCPRSPVHPDLPHRREPPSPYFPDTHTHTHTHTQPPTYLTGGSLPLTSLRGAAPPPPPPSLTSPPPYLPHRRGVGSPSVARWRSRRRGGATCRFRARLPRGAAAPRTRRLSSARRPRTWRCCWDAPLQEPRRVGVVAPRRAAARAGGAARACRAEGRPAVGAARRVSRVARSVPPRGVWRVAAVRGAAAWQARRAAVGAAAVDVDAAA